MTDKRMNRQTEMSRAQTPTHTDQMESVSSSTADLTMPTASTPTGRQRETRVTRDADSSLGTFPAEPTIGQSVSTSNQLPVR
ncbi:hypothetical protein PAMP_002456 [Pampus punctatissimus]